MTTPTTVPPGFAELAEPLRAANLALLAALAQRGIAPEPYPTFTAPGNPQGIAAARAHPMQGILKYHGLTDWDWRIAYLPSISVTNDAAETLTYVAFDPALAADEATIGGVPASGRELERVVQCLDVVRAAARIASRARVISRNTARGGSTGKGLGTSASASAALAHAAISAALGPDAANNGRFLTAVARLLAGSGCRSAAGGVALWLSYPGCPHEDSFALRLDRTGELDALRLITVPIDSRIGLKTELAHVEAPHSSLFQSWVLSRGAEALACLEAVAAGDWRTLGRWAELDSVRLHGITMSGSMENKLFAWEPENIQLFRMCNDLRDQGVPVYASTDTGPTVVFLTHQDHEEAVVQAITALGMAAVRGRIAPGAHAVDPAAALAMLRT